jgi:hypothetical protein
MTTVRAVICTGRLFASSLVFKRFPQRLAVLSPVSHAGEREDANKSDSDGQCHITVI